MPLGGPDLLAANTHPAATLTPCRLSVITGGPDSPTASAIYVYASGDVLWAVKASDPALTDILTKLP